MKKHEQNNFPKGEIIIYKTKDGKAKLEVNLREETVWLAQKQIAELFSTQRPAITKHLNNIFKSGELDENSVSSILEHTAADGKKYKTTFYNLDMIISVGYRVNSARATQFRIWATKVLHNHIVKGFTLNEKRLKEQKIVKLQELENAISLLRGAIKHRKLNKSETEGLLTVITDYANSWVLLQKYDEGKLVVKRKASKLIWELDYDTARKSIAGLKADLFKRKQASEIFGQERGHGLSAIIGNLNQSFGGRKLYPSVEVKVAHLLYFVIKDHPFVDGNKRIASLFFIQFLAENDFLFRKNGERKINDNALVALALLVAQSNPKEKEVMVALVANLLQ